MSNVSFAEAKLPSVAVTVTETVPTSALAGVPLHDRVPALTQHRPVGLLDANVGAPPTSMAANVFAADVKLKAMSSVAGVFVMGLATVGASLVLATVMSNVSLAEA